LHHICEYYPLVEFAGHIKQMMRMLSPVLRVPVLRVPVLLLFIALLWHNQALSETTIDLR
jgi:hypothetical protein